jgi:hypothetical protein
VLFLVENLNKLISNYSPELSPCIILFLSFFTDEDNRPPNGFTCFLDIVIVYFSKVTVMTVTRYDFISIKDLQAARRKLIKEVGSWAFQFHCAGCHNLLLTGSIPIPLVQTYCTCLTKLNPGTKKCASSYFERVL